MASWSGQLRAAGYPLVMPKEVIGASVAPLRQLERAAT